MNVDRKLNEIQYIKDDIVGRLIKVIQDSIAESLRIAASAEADDYMIKAVGMGKAEERITQGILSDMMKELAKQKEKFINQIDDQKKLERGYHLRHSEIFEGEIVVFSKAEFEELVHGIKLLADYARRK